MAKHLGPRCRLARRIGADLSLTSGIKPLESKCKLSTPPGMHGAKRVRTSDYARSLLEKQRICWTYGILDSALYRYHLEAIRRRHKIKKGVDSQLAKEKEGYNLILRLECRLDNIVYRMGFAATRAEAKQLINHKTILLNGRVVDKPSYEVKLGDQVSIREKSKNQIRIQEARKLAKQRTEVEGLKIDDTLLTGEVIALPKLPTDFQLDKVKEFYSK
jgi:small subunit ribosomal protein S4